MPEGMGTKTAASFSFDLTEIMELRYAEFWKIKLHDARNEIQRAETYWSAQKWPEFQEHVLKAIEQLRWMAEAFEDVARLPANQQTAYEVTKRIIVAKMAAYPDAPKPKPKAKSKASLDLQAAPKRVRKRKPLQLSTAGLPTPDDIDPADYPELTH